MASGHIIDRATGKKTYYSKITVEGETVKASKSFGGTNHFHLRNVDVEEDKCFLATASGLLEPDLYTLRRYRDEVLISSALGRVFISAYNRYAPGLVPFIQTRPNLQRHLREGFLERIVDYAQRQLELRDTAKSG